MSLTCGVMTVTNSLLLFMTLFFTLTWCGHPRHAVDDSLRFLEGMVGDSKATDVFFIEQSNGAVRFEKTVLISVKAVSDRMSNESMIQSCGIFADSDVVTHILQQTEDWQEIILVSEIQFERLIQTCGDEKLMQPFMESYLRDLDHMIRSPAGQRKRVYGGLLIYPGTKWCGAGDIADNYDHLGSATETDECCRDHDHCPDNIPASASRHDLYNPSFLTRNNCSCDHDFHNCLQESHSFVSDQVGRLFFNIVQVQCFTFDRPITRCLKKKGFLHNTIHNACQKYEREESRAEEWQFVDAHFYEAAAGPLVYVSGVSETLEKPINTIKNETVNGGAFGNIVAG